MAANETGEDMEQPARNVQLHHLFSATKIGNHDLIWRLITENNIHPDIQREEDGYTALHLACRYGRAGAAQYLLQVKRCPLSGARLMAMAAGGQPKSAGRSGASSSALGSPGEMSVPGRKQLLTKAGDAVWPCSDLFAPDPLEQQPGGEGFAGQEGRGWRVGMSFAIRAVHRSILQQASDMLGR
eukprot:751100-Hanusia_phi.AAC.3